MSSGTSRVVCDMAMSLDGYVAGPHQSLEQPFGEGVGDRLHQWMFDEAEEHAEVIEAVTAAGAFIMGRNMFSPGRGAWDLGWTGWWGEEPPYHAPVFVLTHHEREPLPMKGGTTFHFVTGGIEAALERAREAAGDRDVAIAGGAATVNQYLAAGLIDELRLHVAPVIIGRGERLLHDVGDITLEPVAAPTGSRLVTHLTYRIVR
ncbi:Dihydrofolate reductase [[Actinomadura] parvosata subsp. kistnae]|uniref:5-amino-6-(5-phosphoribosylamino)uracil reductase n=2 Tax=Nonomuraea TaxID=83681 RepID=A0A1V0AAV6_9ACTN|nr:5-amino-6-(5-phosphoribosylamino)uracil reductase [Nonomuraea sp. ATCC 55076]SPL94461.1 Dihydrofolate reductase [Actinomadura parvosata subsp. kistnae]